jgi:phosphoribosyl-AMP cyclohydrolase
VIAQEKDKGDVLMFAWMNRVALQKLTATLPFSDMDWDWS